MGIFSNLFGSKKETSDTNDYRPREKYNIMKNIALVKSEKLENSDEYKLIENGIYQDLNSQEDAKYRMTLSFELESHDDDQYPLEDILDKYLMYVSDFYETINIKSSNKFTYEFGGYLDGMKEAKEIIGKTVYNKDFIDEEGQVRVDLIIE